MKNGGDELDAFELEEVSGDEFGRADASSSAPPPAKRSRRTADKRVVTVPITEGKGAGEGAPPPDSWTWRKYGQKPIKGSPFPRGYYRCSSSKGCPARKQVERSRLDPAVIVITYSFDHSHSIPLPRNHHPHHKTTTPPPPVEEPPSPQQPKQYSGGTPDSAERDSIAVEESAFAAHVAVEDLPWWLGDACSAGTGTATGTATTTSPSAADSDELLYGSVFFAAEAAALPEEERAEAADGGEEEDSLFAGLGELPECSVVLRRGLTSASWWGATG